MQPFILVARIDGSRYKSADFMDMIKIRNVSKVYCRRVTQKSKLKSFFLPRQETFKALSNVDLKIASGETFVLLGPNGAGKTTLIKILCGLLLPTEGEVLVRDRPVAEVQQEIGLMLGFSMIYYRLTGYDNLKYFAKLYGIKNYQERIEKLAEILDLGSWLDEYVEHYSTGMKSKLALARALIHDPSVIILDEPTAGLDPAMAQEIRRRIKIMGKTIFLTTHNMSEAGELASRIAFLNRGKIYPFPRDEKSLESAFLNFVERKSA